MDTPVRASISDPLRNERPRGEELLACPRRLLGPLLRLIPPLVEEMQVIQMRKHRKKLAFKTRACYN